jgi:hypothetical protein
VLKDDMPEAQKAQEYATKTSQVLAACLDAVRKQDGSKYGSSGRHAMSKYMEDVVAKSEV